MANANIATTISLPEGSLTADLLHSGFELPVAKNVQRPLAKHRVRLADLRKPDLSSVLPTSTTTGDVFLKIAGGTHGSASPLVQSADFASASGSQGLRIEAFLPPNYEDGETIAIVLRAKLTTDASVTKTLDVECYKPDGDGSVGSDLCSTSAQSLTTSWANYTFVITPTGLVAGDPLDIEVTVALNDGVAGSGVVANISVVELQFDTRG